MLYVYLLGLLAASAVFIAVLTRPAPPASITLPMPPAPPPAGPAPLPQAVPPA